MKKEYITPQIECQTILNSSILSVSGETREQYAKPCSFSSFEDEDDEEEVGF